MQIRTLEEYNHLKKVYFNRVKELNQIQSILDIYAETFEPNFKIEDSIENISQEDTPNTPNELNKTNSNKIKSQKLKENLRKNLRLSLL